MEWNEEEHEMSTAEVDSFLSTLDDLINITQEAQWMKYDESCMHVKYALLIKTIYDMILAEGWTSEQIKNDVLFHIDRAEQYLKERSENEQKPSTNNCTEEEFLEKLEAAKAKYLD